MPDKREMSRREAMRVVGEKLTSIYCKPGASGRITIDVRSGKAIWVKPVLCRVSTDIHADMHDVLSELEHELARFEAEGLSGCVHVLVCRGRPMQVEGVVECEKVRVG